jgi:hypothetical protein
MNGLYERTATAGLCNVVHYKYDFLIFILAAGNKIQFTIIGLFSMPSFSAFS